MGKKKTKIEVKRAEKSSEEKFRQLLKEDTRYKQQAYRFVFEALEYTQKMLDKDIFSDDIAAKHVTGQELLEGIRQYALQQFGYMTKTVFEQWGITKTEDFGEIVFNLVERGLMLKTESDSRQDFKDGYDFDEAFDRDLKIEIKAYPKPSSLCQPAPRLTGGTHESDIDFP